MAFHRPYKRIGVEKGDELRVAGVDHTRTTLSSWKGRMDVEVRWEPGRLAARTGGVEVYKVERMELRQPATRFAGPGTTPTSGLMNSQAAEVMNVRGEHVTFRVEDGRVLDMTTADLPASPRRPRMGLDRTRLPGADGR